MEFTIDKYIIHFPFHSEQNKYVLNQFLYS